MGFLMVMWQKLAASSSRALLKSLSGRRERLLQGKIAATLSAEEAEEDLSADREASDIIKDLPAASAYELSRVDRVIELLKVINIDSKARTFIEKLQELFREEDPNGKVIVFTEFRETQDMLVELCAAQGWSAHRFHGQLKLAPKGGRDRLIPSWDRAAGPGID